MSNIRLLQSSKAEPRHAPRIVHDDTSPEELIRSAVGIIVTVAILIFAYVVLRHAAQ